MLFIICFRASGEGGVLLFLPASSGTPCTREAGAPRLLAPGGNGGWERTFLLWLLSPATVPLKGLRERGRGRCLPGAPRMLCGSGRGSRPDTAQATCRIPTRALRRLSTAPAPRRPAR